MIGGGIGVFIGQFLKALREYARPDGKKPDISIEEEYPSFWGDAFEFGEKYGSPSARKNGKLTQYRGDGRGTYSYTITPIETPQTPPTGEQEIGDNK